MTTTTITHNDDSTVLIEGSIPAEEFDKHKDASLKKLGQNVSVDGFRAGHVPADIVEKRVGEYALLEEMANRALSEHYPAILIEHKIDAIGKPEVSITKLAMGNPLEFKITTAVMPKITLTDYKKTATEANAKNASEEVSVSDEEVETFITNILKQQDEAKDGATPELTDELAKKFGNFESAADMRTKIKEGMLTDKRRETVEKKRLAVLDALVEATPFALPATVVDAETDKMMMRLSMDLERMGLSPEEYFKKLGKDPEVMRGEIRPDAEKRARVQLILNEIALAEKLVPSKEEIEKEVEKIFDGHEPHEGHDEATERERATIYVTTVLTNEKVLRFLEEL